MKIDIIKEKANQFLATNKYHPILLYAAISSIIASIIMLSLVLSLLVAKWLWVFGLIVFIALYLLSAPIEVSQADYYMRSYNKKTTEYFVFYEGFKKEYFKKAVLIRLIRTLMVLLGLPFVFFPGIFISIRTAYVFEILRINPKLKITDIFKESNNLVKSSEFSFFLTAASFTGWWILSVISLGAVSVYASPYYRTAKSIFFRNITLQKDDNDKNYLLDLKTHFNSILSNEIASMEKKIKSIESQSKASIPIDRNEDEVHESNLKSKSFAPITPPFLQTKSTSGEKIYMDEIGDIRGVISADKMVEEVEIPQISMPRIEADVTTNGYAQMATSDMEQNSNESVDDFRRRVEKMRLMRDKERAFKTKMTQDKPQVPELSMEDSIDTDEAELRSALEDEEAIRLALMEEEALLAEEAEAFIAAKNANARNMSSNSDGNGTKFSIVDDVCKSEKLNIALEGDEDEDKVVSKSTTVVTTTTTTKTISEDADVKKNATAQKTTETSTAAKSANNSSTASVANNTSFSQPKRLSREEILEKIRLEREKKGQK